MYSFQFIYSQRFLIILLLEFREGTRKRTQEQNYSYTGINLKSNICHALGSDCFRWYDFRFRNSRTATNVVLLSGSYFICFTQKINGILFAKVYSEADFARKMFSACIVDAQRNLILGVIRWIDSAWVGSFKNCFQWSISWYFPVPWCSQRKLVTNERNVKSLFILSAFALHTDGWI